MTIVGEYSREGFRVVNRETGDTLFSEGNSPGGGAVVLDRYHRHALPIRMIRIKCEIKTREIAAAKGAAFGGIEKIEED